MAIQTGVVLLASASRTASGQGLGVAAYQDHTAFYLDVTAVTGTAPTLDVTIEEFDPVSGKWFLIGTFAQKIAAGAERIQVSPLTGNSVRAAYVIGGTLPDFTFSVGMNAKGN